MDKQLILVFSPIKKSRMYIYLELLRNGMHTRMSTATVIP